MTFIVCAVAAIALDVLAVVLVFGTGYFVAKRKWQERTRQSLFAINSALRDLSNHEIALAVNSNPDKILGLLAAADAKRKKMAANARAREAEFKTS